MKRRKFMTLLGGAAAWPLAARAEQARPLMLLESHMTERQNTVVRLFGAILLAAIFLIACELNAVLAGRSLSWHAEIKAGETMTIKNLLWSGPARKYDRKYLIKSYSHKSSARVAFTYIVSRLDGSSESFTVSEGQDDSFNRVFYGGILDVQITRLSSEEPNQPVFIRGGLYTCLPDQPRDC